jgi:hypothetical protein
VHKGCWPDVRLPCLGLCPSQSSAPCGCRFYETVSGSPGENLGPGSSAVGSRMGTWARNPEGPCSLN